MEEIINELFSELGEAVEKQMSDTQWTKTIKSIFEEIGHRHSYQVRPSLKNDLREWLYDIIWYKGDPNEFIESVDLICESELDTSINQVESVLYDFNKLLVSEAATKIMITHTYKEGRIEDIIEACKNAIKNYSNPAKTVHLINYDFQKGLELYKL